MRNWINVALALSLLGLAACAPEEECEEEGNCTPDEEDVDQEETCPTNTYETVEGVCAETDGCPPNAYEVDSGCTCFDDHVVNWNGSACVPHTSTDACPTNASPEQLPSGKWTCDCDEGFVVNAAGNACVAESEEEPECPPNSSPGTGASGQPTCFCDEGYVVDPSGTSCVPSEDGCPDNASPTSDGGCACDPGWQPNDANNACVEVDQECEGPSFELNGVVELCCPVAATSVAVVGGGATCICPAPSTYDPGANACVGLPSCGPNASVVDGYCACDDGYFLNSVGDCEVSPPCPDGKSYDGSECVCDDGSVDDGAGGCLTACPPSGEFIELGSALGAPFDPSLVGETLAEGTDELTCGDNSFGDEKVFRWTAPYDGVFSFRAPGTFFDVLHYIGFFDEACGELSCEQPTTAMPSRKRAFTAGETVFVVIDDDGFGEFELFIEPACGDGVLDAGETCDDGNRLDGDYCASDCSAETGTCGDGTVQDTEVCDGPVACSSLDPAFTAGDATCLPGCDGFDVSSCTGEAVCPVDVHLGTGFTTVEGDTSGKSKPYVCGLSSAPQSTYSWTAPHDGDFHFSVQPMSGVTRLALFGELDVPDGHPQAGVCLPFTNCHDFEQRRSMLEGDVITVVLTSSAPSGAGPYAFTVEDGCGDGELWGFEECDDGNQAPGDGCDATCTREPPECGDGYRDGQEGEECDDGNNRDGDGCDALCQREPNCGDSWVDAPETCEDGNLDNGDGCDDTCMLEVPDTEPNESLAEAAPAVLGERFIDSFDIPGDVDWFAVTLDVPSALRVLTSDPLDEAGCAANTRISLYDAQENLLFRDEDFGPQECAALFGGSARGPGVLDPGTYYVRIDAPELGTYAAQFVAHDSCLDDGRRISDTCDDGTFAPLDACLADCRGSKEERIPATSVTSNELGVAPRAFSGRVAESLSSDSWTFTTTGRATLRASVAGPTKYGYGLLPSDVQLTRTNGDEIALHVPSGTYEVRVRPDINANIPKPNGSPYFGTILIDSVCADGRVTGVETCDDGGREDGDGCSALCQIE